jgi:hypothetical protein
LIFGFKCLYENYEEVNIQKREGKVQLIAKKRKIVKYLVVALYNKKMEITGSIKIKYGQANNQRLG